MTERILAVSVAAFVALCSAHAQEKADGNWPAWRGPHGTGAAKGNPPSEWSETNNVKWKVAIPGVGHASPIVWGDRVYVLTAVKTDRSAASMDPTDAFAADGVSMGPTILAQERPDGPPPGGERRRQGGGPGRAEKPTNVFEFVVLALNRSNGETVWKKVVKEAVPHAGTHPDGTFASASPVTDGKYIYAFFGSYGLYCLDPSGKVVWDAHFGEMRTRNSFGEGASPALHGDTLVVNWDHEGDDFIVALDASTGKERWRKPRNEATSWTTPLIVDVGGKAQVIVPGEKRCIAYALSNGETVWECSGLTSNVIPSAVHADGVAYLMSGFRGTAAKAIRLADAKGNLDNDKSAIAWSTDALKTPYVPSPVLADGRLYFFDNNRAVITCADTKTGEKLYGPERIEGLQQIYASPVAAAGRIYVAARDGETAVIKAGATYERLGVNKLDDGFDASPAIAGDELFLRGRKSLYCIAAK